MPLPVAHSLIGASVAAALDAKSAARWQLFWLSALPAVCPDSDYLLNWLHIGRGGWHHGFTHSIMFALFVGALTAFVSGWRSVRGFIVFSAAVASHPLLDYLMTESRGPLGQRVLSVNDMPSEEERKQMEKWPKIIGVVGDVKHFGLELRNAADLYVNYKQRPRRIGDMIITVRTNGEPAALASTLREQVKTLDANLPLSFEAMDKVFARSTADRRYNVILLSAFAALALLLAVIGIYGVMSYAVTQSTREIGIRLALGAQKRHVLKLVVGQGLMLTLAGAVIGLIAAFALTRLMTSLLFGVKATDPLTFIAVTILLTLVALLGCYLPARRATRVDPMVTLRYE